MTEEKPLGLNGYHADTAARARREKAMELACLSVIGYTEQAKNIHLIWRAVRIEEWIRTGVAPPLGPLQS
jgi:hypothetical protein